MNARFELDAADLLRRVAERIPPAQRPNVVVIGSIATAWAFRDVSGTYTVATKDIDLLLRPAVDAVTAAETLGQALLDEGWEPRYPNGILSGTADTPDDRLPALRLSPPGEADGWFVELLADPPVGQTARKHWRRFETGLGTFGLPSFRYMHVAIHDAQDTAFGLRVAQPACMALAHLLEHADPDRTPISGLPGHPPRFVKDVGRAIALWWLDREASPVADDTWRSAWHKALATRRPARIEEAKTKASAALAAVADYLREAHGIALNSVLAPHGTTFEVFARAHASLSKWVQAL